jgi:hypothetical protein
MSNLWEQTGGRGSLPLAVLSRRHRQEWGDKVVSERLKHGVDLVVAAEPRKRKKHRKKIGREIVEWELSV